LPFWQHLQNENRRRPAYVVGVAPRVGNLLDVVA
jgi:hypothetical protein